MKALILDQLEILKGMLVKDNTHIEIITSLDDIISTVKLIDEENHIF